MVIKSLQFHSIDHDKTLFLFLFLFLSLVSSLGVIRSHSTRATAFIYAGCSDEKYLSNSPFEASLNSFLTSAVSSSPQALYNSFAAGNETSPAAEAAIFGVYQCRGDLKPPECAECVRSAASQIALACPNSFGASLQLQGCYLRYEHVDFLGKLETNMRHKRCGKSVGGDGEFLRRRDDVVAELQGAGAVAGFRVSGSGLVEGVAQCIGDLSPADCSACLADCVGKLKSLCGSASAGDVFLAQCYVRYWGSGYYDMSSGSSSEDDVGKTVAIIVGVLAGIAVLIVLLSICRKTMSY